MKIELIMGIARALYKVMRPVLQKAIDDPDADWDDRLMAAADAFFGWEPAK